MKLSHYIAEFLAQKNMTHVFMITGGGAMHLNDALGKHPKLKTVFLHHEQSLTMAAESYARLSGKMAIVNVTTGPGGINALNGVFGAYTDSIPMFVISGQVKRETCVESLSEELKNLRQLGDQEYPHIIHSVAPMTKYAVSIHDPNEIKYHLERAYFEAVSGRPGPVWLDIPLDVQAAEIEPTHLIGMTPVGADLCVCPDYSEIIQKISQAERPVILLGTGVRISGQAENFLKLCEFLQIPVVTAFNAHDLIPNEHDLYAGRPGTVGDRPGNFAVQNSDLLLILGCRLNIRQIGYDFKSFARAAYKIMVDVDSLEMQKPTVNINFKIQADLKKFIPDFLDFLKSQKIKIQKSEWLTWCQERVKKYPVVLPEYFQNRLDKINPPINPPINPYVFMQKLSQYLPPGAITVTGNATACVTAFQAFEIKKGSRLFSNSGSASMGYDLPAAIGAHMASNQKIICLSGDGSFMMNLQELAQISFKQYPIKIFLINNGGYLSIRLTQKNFFGMPYVGCGEESGVGFPDFKKLADAFGLNYKILKTHEDLSVENFDQIFSHHQPVLCEVLTQAIPFSPKAASQKLPDGKMVSQPLENLAPFLPVEELLDNLLIPRLAND